MINAEVQRRPKESIESLISRFSKKVSSQNVFLEMKLKQRFLTKKQRQEIKKRFI